MVKEEIVEGLRLAVSKGEPLEKAMASFYNAGYTKEDIEEAANFLQVPQPQQYSQPSQQSIPTPQQPQYSPPPQQSLPPPQQQNIKPLVQPLQGSVVQRVSEYGRKPKGGKAVTIILFIILFILLAILAAVILFKKELSNFFTNLFWRALF